MAFKIRQSRRKNNTKKKHTKNNKYSVKKFLKNLQHLNIDIKNAWLENSQVVHDSHQ